MDLQDPQLLQVREAKQLVCPPLEGTEQAEDFQLGHLHEQAENAVVASKDGRGFIQLAVRQVYLEDLVSRRRPVLKGMQTREEHRPLEQEQHEAARVVQVIELVIVRRLANNELPEAGSDRRTP